MCNCRLKYPRGMSIVTCIVLYVALIGLLVAYFQPYWLVIPNESSFGCLDEESNQVERLTATDKGACGLSGMCYPMTHIDKISNMSCYPDMGVEQCVWYNDLETIGNIYDQVCTLLFLGGLVLCLFAWFYSMIGCCSLTCCCCNLYTAISVMLTMSVVAILVSVLLWLGMMGNYALTDQSCLNVFCDDVGAFDFGNCSIGWSGYLGFASWLLLVVATIVTCCTARHYGRIIAEEAIPAKNMINPYEKKKSLSQDNAFYFREQSRSSRNS